MPRVQPRMNITQVHRSIASVHKSIGDMHLYYGASPYAARNNLRNDIDRLTVVVDAEKPSGAADLYLLRMASEAITAGESTLKFFATVTA